jgi:transposase
MDVSPSNVIDPAQLPDDASVLKALIAQLLETLHSKTRQIDQLTHRLQQLLRAHFGQKAEKIDPAQMLLFAQQILAEAQTPELPKEEALAPTPRKGHGRKKLPRNLPRRTVVLDVPVEQRKCSCCGQEMTKIGQESSEQIDYVPASVCVVETVRPKYACKHCPDGTVVTADKPRSPIEKGLPAPGMLAHVITSKYCDHQPLNRLSHIFQRHGLEISRSTMGGWMAAAAQLAQPLVDVMTQEVLASNAVHTDDTPMPVLDRQRDTARQGRLWIYRGDDLHPYTVYDYTPTHKRDGPVEFLGEYEGYLCADAYGGYDGIYLGSEGKVIEVLCWAHARRKHFDAQDSDLPRATVALAYIRRLYQVERQAKELFAKQAEGPEARSLSAIRLGLRQEHSLPVLKEFEAWMRQQTSGVAADGASLPAGPVLPKSPLGMAISYCLNNWPALLRYTDDGNLDVDNNLAEQGLRGPVTGRRNYTFFGSDNGGRTAAVLYSLVASAKRHGLDPFAYLRDVLGRISDHPSNKLHELLPDHWKLAHAAPVPAQA